LLPLLCAGSVEYCLKDYRDVSGTFDRIVSVGMFEHVGARNYDCFLQLCRSLLTAQGIFLLHTIGINSPDVCEVDPWLNANIFPGGMLPRLASLTQKCDGLFVVEDLHNFGVDYCRTLLAWRANFDRSWPQLQDKYGAKFGRMWKFYLGISAAMFFSRRLHLWQIVLSPTGLKSGYVADR
jgi:cyclopropane-fatty-acyl-phospholipid synthase